MTTRVCVADGMTVFRGAVRQVLVREQDFEVVEARDLEALELALQEGADIALIDQALPPAGALAAVTAARGCCPEIVVWALNPKPGDVLAAIQRGATGYLHKEISPTGLVRSLRGAARGESPLSRDLAALMIGALHAAEAEARSRDLASLLSLREREVLGHVARGSRNRDIASSLAISEFTVKRHVQNILQKLELPSRRAAATFYASIGAMANVRDGAAV